MSLKTNKSDITSAFPNNNLSSDVVVYSFKLEPGKCQPSGHISDEFMEFIRNDMKRIKKYQSYLNGTAKNNDSTVKSTPSEK